MKRNTLTLIVGMNAVLLIALVAVGNSPAVAEEGDAAGGSAYLLQEQPKDAAEVKATRTDAKDKQPVVVVGRIGGRVNPWIKNAAAFSIVDRSLRACNDIEGDTCKTPWDYCCETDVPEATVLVMFVDGEGKVIKQDARELLGVKELDTVFIEGTAKRDQADNVVILASKLFVPETEKESTE